MIARWRIWLQVAITFLALCLLSDPAQAQTSQAGPFDVFLNSSISKGRPGLFFVNMRTGLSTTAVTNGTRHAVLGGGVLFQENDTDALKMAYPDGHIEPYAPIQPSGGQTVNWIASGNGKWIAWSIAQSQAQSLLSDMYVAGADGSGAKLVLHASSTKNVDTIPLALSDDGGTVFYTRQTHDTQPYQLFPVATDVFSVDVASGKATTLPGKTDCACAVGFSPDGQRFARLEAAGDQTGFGIHLWNLSINVDSRINPPQIAHHQAGNVLISHDGNVIVYTSAHGVAPAKGVPPEQFAVVAVNVPQQLQRVIVSPLKSNLRAVAFSPDDSAVIMVGTDTDGTYKLRLKDGDFRLVSVYTYIGTIMP